MGIEWWLGISVIVSGGPKMGCGVGRRMEMPMVGMARAHFPGGWLWS